MEGYGERSANKHIEVEIPSDDIPGTSQRIVISMPLKRPLADADDNAPKAKRRGFQYMSLAAKKALCEYKRDKPKATHNELRGFLEKDFGVKKVPGSTMSSILSNAHKYLSLDDSQATTGRLKIRPGNNQKMEEVLYSWYKKALAEKIPVTDAQIVAVARKIGERLKVPQNFAYSYNWLSGFKIRMGIVSKANVTGRKIKSKVVGSKRIFSPPKGSSIPISTSMGNPFPETATDVLPRVKVESADSETSNDQDDVKSLVYWDGDLSRNESSDFYQNYVHVTHREEEEDNHGREETTDIGLEMDCELRHHTQSHESGAFVIPHYMTSRIVQGTVERTLPTKTYLGSQQTHTHRQCKYTN